MINWNLKIPFFPKGISSNVPKDSPFSFTKVMFFEWKFKIKKNKSTFLQII
jgi:hypothetical protein